MVLASLMPGMDNRIMAFLGTPRTTRPASHFAIGDGEVFNGKGGWKDGKGQDQHSIFDRDINTTR